MKRKHILAICIIVVIAAAFSLAGYRLHDINKLQEFKESAVTLATNVPNYNLVGSREYETDGRICIGYYVIIDPGATDEQLYKIFYRICNDEYYLHTMWAYSSQQNMNASTYDIAMLTETDRSKWPEIKRPDN